MTTTTRIEDIRRENLRSLFALYSASAVSRKLGYKATSFMSQIAGPSPTREVTDKTARAIEEAYGYPRGTLDQQGWSATAEVQTTPVVRPVDWYGDVVRQVVLKVCRASADQGVTYSPEKMAELSAMAFTDAMENGGGGPRDSYIGTLLKLLSK